MVRPRWVSKGPIDMISGTSIVLWVTSLALGFCLSFNAILFNLGQKDAEIQVLKKINDENDDNQPKVHIDINHPNIYSRK